MSTAADRVFDEVVSDILSGSLRPREQISERDLVARFGVSRTPVREAVKRLFERGFVEAGPKGVAVVADIDGDDLRKLYDLRLKLEAHASKLTATHITADEIAELKAINREFSSALARRDLVRMLEVRAEFHAVAVRATGNRWLAEVLIMLRDRAYPVRHLHWQDVDRAAQTVAIHNQMLAALQKRDAKRYRDLVLQQIGAAIDCYDSQLRAPLKPRRQSRRPGSEKAVVRAAAK